MIVINASVKSILTPAKGFIALLQCCRLLYRICTARCTAYSPGYRVLGMRHAMAAQAMREGGKLIQVQI